MKSEFLCGCELRNAWKGLIFQTYFTSSSPLIFHIFHVSYFLGFIFFIFHIFYISYFFVDLKCADRLFQTYLTSSSYSRQELHYCHIFMNFDWMENSSNILRHRDKVFNNLLGTREITHSAYNGSQKKHLKLFFVQGGVGSICWNWRRPGIIYMINK